MTEPEAASYLRVKPVTMKSWRRTANGPRWYRIGRLVRYAVEDLDEWVRLRERADVDSG
jgi:hypothetical protein